MSIIKDLHAMLSPLAMPVALMTNTVLAVPDAKIEIQGHA
jgi:hypothetical protein